MRSPSPFPFVASRFIPTLHRARIARLIIGAVCGLSGSLSAVFAQLPLPAVGQQPVSQTAVLGSNVGFVMDVTVPDDFDQDLSCWSIKWYRDGVELPSGDGKISSDFFGANRLVTSLNFPNFASTDVGSYTCRIKYTCSIFQYVIDSGSDEIRTVVMDPTTRLWNAVTFATYVPGTNSAFSAGEHRTAAASSIFNDPRGIVVDSSGNLFVADRGNYVIRRITPDGNVTTFAGSVGSPGGTNGTGTNARFSGPIGLVIDNADNLYVGDGNWIRKITPAAVVTTLAGQPNAGSADGTGTAAQFFYITGMAIDVMGNIYVADALNNTIRRVTPTGVVTTFAGQAGTTGSADGTGTAAQFNYPVGVALDLAGNVYVTDGQNNTIRKITGSRVVTTLAGSPGNAGSADGTGTAARFYYPWGIAVDEDTGNLFVSDSGNSTIRMITPTGVVTTIAGVAGSAGNVDGVGSAARLNTPYQITLANYTIMSAPATLTVGTPTNPPTIVTQPASQTAVVGSSVNLIVVASGAGAYQWKKNGADITGATSTTLTLPNVSAADAASYTVVASNSVGSVTSADAVVTVTGNSRISNVSIRSAAGTGDNTLIVGFVIGGSGTKQVLSRGIGPSLAQFGVTGTLADPQLAVHTKVNNVDTVLSSNAGWGGVTTLSNAFSQVGAFSLAPSSKDSATLSALTAGTYTTVLSSVSGGTGVALVEVYDADTGSPTARFTNLSARTQAGTGDQTLTAGFVITGTSPKSVLIRGIGPTLAQFGVSDTLANPQLALLTRANNQDTVIASNDGWGGTAALSAAFALVGAFSLPTNSADAALLVTLQPGTYTAEVTGANGSTGIALVELYEMP